jgi:hypothetical protein
VLVAKVKDGDRYRVASSSRYVRKKGAAPISGAEEQTTRAIGAYVQYACLLSLQMGSIH